MTDLAISASAVNSRGVPYITLGDSQHFTLELVVRNSGDPAYLAEITIAYPADIMYVKTVKEPEHRHVICRVQRNFGIQDGASQSGMSTLLCEVGNPVPANSTVPFKIRFDSLRMKEVYTSDFVLSSTTLSEDSDTGNNNISVVVPVQYEYNLDIGG